MKMGKTAEPELDDSSESRDSPSPRDPAVEELITENGLPCPRDLCTSAFKKFRKFLKDAKIYEKLDCFVKYMTSNPLLLLVFIFLTAILIIPVLLFTVFAIINVAIAFTGFMIVEVVLLLIGLTVLCCILFFVLSGVVMTGISVALSYYVTYSSFTLVKRKIQSK